MIKKTKFKVEKIDFEQGLCTVRHINPYGPVASDEITEEEINKNDNPNHDVIATFYIPFRNYEFIDAEELLTYIAKNYPNYTFEDYLLYKLADKRQDLLDLVGNTYEKDVETPFEMTVGQVQLVRLEDGLDMDTL